ncbi:hypothetical protein CC1G_08352 [Coprinopsis cinerea okayama7|uniref:Peptidase A1 domain-containing protein n=1 Tax=Coprinopsis cinerea (strain Okayama-7 / 130 / ATCC MYA-4618 / FGSC 9003) TaxID=240176 RepID=A8NA96_COPC7|nr:hypothetical protein CC1G_08352 [Coprinopsis cinerea okayama7\|eukprot:XP_001831748.2 hypothetical protein CC1G_08352 [Coprinopsis cinerea okayama7\
MYLRPLFSAAVLLSCLLPFSTATSESSAAYTLEDLFKSSGLTKGNRLGEYSEEAYKNFGELKKLLPTSTRNRYKIKTPGGTTIKKMTNAQRLALGLPLNPPVRRDARAKQLMARQASSGPPEILSLNLGLLDDIGGSTPLTISLTVDSLVTQPTNLRITLPSIAEEDYPLLGLVQGRDNDNGYIGLGSPNYLVLARVDIAGTEPGSTGSTIIGNSFSDTTGLPRIAQTDVWRLNRLTGTIVPEWINPDGCYLPTLASSGPLQLYIQNGVIYAIADIAAFLLHYPQPVVPIFLGGLL